MNLYHSKLSKNKQLVIAKPSYNDFEVQQASVQGTEDYDLVISTYPTTSIVHPECADAIMVCGDEKSAFALVRTQNIINSCFYGKIYSCERK